MTEVAALVRCLEPWGPAAPLWVLPAALRPAARLHPCPQHPAGSCCRVRPALQHRHQPDPRWAATALDMLGLVFCYSRCC